MIPDYLLNLFWWVGVPAAWIVLASYLIVRATS